MISLKAMSVGDGYKYLTSHVARGDIDQPAHDGGSTPLTRYYAASGYPTGVWMGAGLEALGEELLPGSPVEEWQMAALFAEGRDPTTGKLLGRAPRPYATVAERIEAKATELPDTLTGDERAAAIATIEAVEQRRVSRTAKGGFDLTFTVPKSVSVLWAIADPATQQVILDAHHATLADTIDYLEREVIFTRVGHGGVAQVDTRGIIAAAFDHWDSRGGDPNLHTHLAVANRVQTIDGRWLTVDSRGLHHAIVGVSELYDTMLADRLTARLGVDWEARERPTRRTVAHEIVDIPEELVAAFSARSAEIDTHYQCLLDTYITDNGHQPTPTEVVRLRQQATLTARPVKRHPAPLPELSATWRTRAETVTGRSAQELVDDALERARDQALHADDIDPETVDAWAALTVAAVQAHRSAWNRWNLLAEAARLTHQLRFAGPADREAFTHRIVAAAQQRSIALAPQIDRPATLEFQRVNGEDVFTQHGAGRYTSQAILAAESYLLELAAIIDTAHAVPFAASYAGRLGDDQRTAAHDLTTSGRSLQVLIGAAGTGKTTTLAAVTAAWIDAHGPGSVVGLAPSASAAEVLAASLGIECENTAKWLHESIGAGATQRAGARNRLAAARPRSASGQQRITDALQQIDDVQRRWTMHPGQLVIVDEASLAGTLSIAALAHQAHRAGAKLLLVGDHAQLSAVDAGGALRMLAAVPGVATLFEVHRFHDEWEREASLALRNGEEEAIAAYLGHGRVVDGDHIDMLESAYAAWLTDTRSGRTSLLIAGDNTTVTELNQRARFDLVGSGDVEADGLTVADGTTIGVGDRIVTRRNNRGLTDGNNWVRNGDTFTVIGRSESGALTVRRHPTEEAGAGVLVLPSWYVTKHTRLAYATTAHRAQGATVDTAHTIVTTGLSREKLYVSMSRGRTANYAYVALDTPGEDPDDARHHRRPANGVEVLRAVLAHSDAEVAATETSATAHRSAESMATLIPIYEHIAQELSVVRWRPRIAATVDPRTATLIRRSDAWPKLTALLRNIELAGLDAEGLLIDATRNGGFDGSEDAGAVLLGRLASAFNRTRLQTQPVHLIAGLVVPAGKAADPGAQAAADHAARAIRQRATHLVHQARRTGEPWLDHLGPEPSDPQKRPAWQTAAEAITTYRERWTIPDPEPLGKQPGRDRAQRRDRARAQRAIDALDRSAAPSVRLPELVDGAMARDPHKRPERTMT